MSTAPIRSPIFNRGTYKLEISHAGFKTYVREPIELHVDEHAQIDVKLEIGRATDQVTVDRGGGTARREQRYCRASREPGTDRESAARRPQPVFTDEPRGRSFLHREPVVFAAVRQWRHRGLLDQRRCLGRERISDRRCERQRQHRTLQPGLRAAGRSHAGISRPEQCLRCPNGSTAGGVINLSIKPGGNHFHGAAYEYLRRTDLDANLFSSNAAGQPRAPRNVDQYGGEIDGPLDIPRIYRGKDRTFFMFALEQYREITPQPVLGSVPTAAQRAGDFSQTFTAAGKLYTVYDPLLQAVNPAYNPAKALSTSNYHYIRTPFANNKIPASRFEPIALNVLKDIPLPNQTGDPVVI